MIYEEALQIVLPFGEFKGLSLGKTIKTTDGRQFLRWLNKRRVEEKLQEALKLVVEKLPDEQMEYS